MLEASQLIFSQTFHTGFDKRYCGDNALSLFNLWVDSPGRCRFVARVDPVHVGHAIDARCFSLGKMFLRKRRGLLSRRNCVLSLPNSRGVCLCPNRAFEPPQRNRNRPVLRRLGHRLSVRVRMCRVNLPETGLLSRVLYAH